MLADLSRVNPCDYTIVQQFLRIAAVAIKTAEDLQLDDDETNDDQDEQLRAAMFAMELDSPVLNNDEHDNWHVSHEDKVQDISTGTNGVVKLSDREQHKWMVQYEEDDAHVCLGISYYSDDNMIKATHYKV